MPYCRHKGAINIHIVPYAVWPLNHYWYYLIQCMKSIFIWNISYEYRKKYYLTVVLPYGRHKGIINIDVAPYVTVMLPVILCEVYQSRVASCLKKVVNIVHLFRFVSKFVRQRLQHINLSKLSMGCFNKSETNRRLTNVQT